MADMQEDNVYKSTFFTIGESDEIKKAREEEQNTTEASIPVIEEALEKLKAHIEAYNKLPSIPDDILNIEDSKAVALRNQVAINKQTVANLLPIAQELEEAITQYKR